MRSEKKRGELNFAGVTNEINKLCTRREKNPSLFEALDHSMYLVDHFELPSQETEVNYDGAHGTNQSEF